MKKLTKLKLNQLPKDNLSNKQMKYIRGGGDGLCGCGCAGSSSDLSNCLANSNGGLDSPRGPAMNCIEPINVYG